MFPQEVQKVYEAIRDAILEEAYEPGQALPEVPLARRYGVARTRIRQVLQRLERDMLVEIVPARGAFVKPISMTEFQEIFEIREALEGIAARLAARKRRDEEIDDLLQRFEALRQDATSGSGKDKILLGGSLHEFVLRSAGNKKIVAILSPLQMQVTRIWRRGLVLSPERIEKAFQEHLEILGFLKAKDEAMAELKMREHIANAFKDYVRVLILKE
jgi:DNA-binding GntR family transcriptional regulator